MKIAAAPERRRGRCGFTLIELLLTLVLLLVLLGAIVMNFTGLQRGVQLEEGGEQLESLIRFARAHAANTGCKVRLTFEEEVDEDFSVPLGNVFVSWEPEPLERPGQFLRLIEVQTLLESLLHLVEVNDVLPLGGHAVGASHLSSDPFDSSNSSESGFASFAPITFYPDGSSDSAEIILAARDSEDERRIRVQIIGATGAIKRQILRDDAAMLVESSEPEPSPEEINAN